MQQVTAVEATPGTPAHARRRILVFDALVRSFHWLLAGAFIAAFVLANLADEHSNAFVAHMLLGMVIVFMIVLRIVWGFVGSRYARFRSFLYGPRETVSYFAGALGRGNVRHYTGHNPGSAGAIFAMLFLFLALGITGWMNARGIEAAEEVHEVLAWTLVAVAALHVAGVILHVVRRKENIVASMIHGHKQGAPSASIGRPRRWAALAFVALTAAWAWALVDGYDRTAQSLKVPLTSATLQLGDDDQKATTAPAREREHDDDEDDD